MNHRNTLVGFTVDSFQGLTPSVIIAGLRMIGVEFIEITKTVFSEVDAVSKKIGSMRTGFHLPLMHDDGWDFSCIDFTEKIDETINNINRHKDSLNLIYAVSHPPESKMYDSPCDSSPEYLFENLKKLRVPVYLENVPGYSPEEFQDLFRQAQSILGSNLAGMCFDGPHFFVRGYNPLDEFQRFFDRIGCIHLSDCHKDDDAHLPFNNGGVFPVEDFLQKVKGTKFSGPITLEIKPNSLKELDIFIASYLKALRYLDYKKFIASRLRWLALKPVVHHFLN